MKSRHLIGTVAMVTVCSAFAGMAMGQIPGLVAYWPFDDGSGLIAADMVGGHDGYLIGGTDGGPTWATGRFGGALSFDGNNDFVGVPPEGGFFGSAQGSVSFWVNTADPVPTDLATMFYGTYNVGDGGGGGTDNGNADQEMEIHLNTGTNGGRVRTRIYYPDGTNVNSQTPATVTVNNGQWHHVVWTWTNTGNNRIYTDGVQRDQDTMAGRPAFLCKGCVRIARGGSSGSRYYGPGLMDDLRVYNRELTAAEVTTLFTTPPGALPVGHVTRTLPSTLLFTPATPVTVKLTATRIGAGGQLVITETVPTGLTPSGITVTAGTQSVAGQNITWTVTPGASGETLTYQVTPSAGGTLTWGGTYTGGTGWTGLVIAGDKTMVGGVAVGQFTWHGNIGDPPLGQRDGNPSLPGSAALAGTVYTISGAGWDVAYNRDRCYVAARAVSGDFTADATVGWVTPGSNTWAKAGIMVRRRMTGASPMAHVALRNPNVIPAGADIHRQYRLTEEQNATGSQLTTKTAPVRFRVSRVGTTITGQYDQASSWVTMLGTPVTIPELSPNDLVVCLFVTSHTDNNADGGTTWTALSTATFNNVVIAPIAALPPAAPSNLTAAVKPGNKVQLTWSDNSNNEQGFILERKTSGTATFAEIARPAANETSYLDSAVTRGQAYTYRIRAFNASGESANTPEVTVVVVAPLDARRWRFYTK